MGAQGVGAGRDGAGMPLHVGADHAEDAAAVVQGKGHGPRTLPATVACDLGGDSPQGGLDGSRQMRGGTFGDQYTGLAPDAAFPRAASDQFARLGYEYMDIKPAFLSRARPGVVRGRTSPAGGAPR
ncbi:hypothetical protein D3C73_1074190 [compost metagenome]